MAAQADPGARQRRSLTGAGARAVGDAAVGPAPVVSLSQVAGDTVGLVEALGIDRGHISGGNMRVKASDSKIKLKFIY